LQITWAADVRILKEVREGNERSGIDGEADEQREENSASVAGQQEPYGGHYPVFVRAVAGALGRHAAELGRQSVGVLEGDRRIARRSAASIRESLAGASGAAQTREEGGRNVRGRVWRHRRDGRGEEVVEQRGASTNPGLKPRCGEAWKGVEGAPRGQRMAGGGPASRRRRHASIGGRRLRVSVFPEHVLLKKAEGLSRCAVSREPPVPGGMADMVFRSGEAREAGGRFRGVLFLDGKPEGRRSEDVEVHRPVEAGKGAPVLRRAAEGLASVPEGLV
jgi:hypothetical protein